MTGARIRSTDKMNRSLNNSVTLVSLVSPVSLHSAFFVYTVTKPFDNAIESLEYCAVVNTNLHMLASDVCIKAHRRSIEKKGEKTKLARVQTPARIAGSST